MIIVYLLNFFRLPLLQARSKKIFSFDAGNDPDITHGDLFRAMGLAKEKKYIDDWSIVFDAKHLKHNTISQHLPAKKKMAHARHVQNNIIHVKLKYLNADGSKVKNEKYYIVLII